MTRRTPRPGDSYQKRGYQLCRVVSLDHYGGIWVCFLSYPDSQRVRYELADFHRLIERETWGRQ